MIGPLLPRVQESTKQVYTLAALTMSGGVDLWTNDRASIRTGVRIHGLLQTSGGHDLAPHTIIQPLVGLAYRW